MLSLCLVEVSPHPQGMPLPAFSISSGFAAGRPDVCCSWLTDEITEVLDPNGPPLGRRRRLPEMFVLGTTCLVAGEVDEGSDEKIWRQQGGGLSQRLRQAHQRMAQAYQETHFRDTSRCALQFV
jgi:hypothetical protein